MTFAPTQYPTPETLSDTIGYAIESLRTLELFSPQADLVKASLVFLVEALRQIEVMKMSAEAASQRDLREKDRRNGVIRIDLSDWDIDQDAWGPLREDLEREARGRLCNDESRYMLHVLASNRLLELQTKGFARFKGRPAEESRVLEFPTSEGD